MRSTRKPITRHPARSLVIALLLTAVAGCWFADPLQPPDWILGTWEDVDRIARWTFTSDDAIWTTGTTTFDFKQMRSPGLTVTDEATATTYTVSMGAGGVYQSYTFAKGDGTSITWVGMSLELLRQ